MRRVAVLLTLAVAWFPCVFAQQANLPYRVLNIITLDILESQINEIVASGYEVVQFLPDYKGRFTVVFRKLPENAVPPKYQSMSRDLAGPFASRQAKDNSPNPKSLVRPLCNSGALGYRVVPFATFYVNQTLHLLLRQDEGQWSYRFARAKGKARAKDLTEAVRDGYLPIAILPGLQPAIMLERRTDQPVKPLIDCRLLDQRKPDELRKSLTQLTTEGYFFAFAERPMLVAVAKKDAEHRDPSDFAMGFADQLQTTLNSSAAKGYRLTSPILEHWNTPAFRPVEHLLGGILLRSNSPWEYRVLEVATPGEMAKQLNRSAAEGFELLDLLDYSNENSTVAYMIIMERPNSAKDAHP